MPSSAIPVAYFAFAHACFAAGLAALALDPGLAGVSFYHPKMIAIVHLLTLGWISGSILGSFYVVAPLALAIPMPAGWRDWTVFAAFATGTTGMVAHFWLGTYDGMAWSAGLVLAAIAHLGWRATRGLSASPAAWPVALHVRLAFFNILAAGVFGILIGLDRTRGFLGLAPVAATYAHAHLAALGWAVMMVMGLSYRLIPMMLPSAMPSGRSLAASAVLLETGLVLLVLSVLSGWPLVPAAGLFILCGLAAFVLQIMRTAARRMPRPPALPRRDWSVWQVHAAFLWLLVASVLGYIVSRADAAPDLPRAWVYGTAGLVGFLAQIIVGMHGRLVPYYAWYRAMAAHGGRPRRGANALPSARFARAVFFAWLPGVPLLAWGLASAGSAAIRSAAVLLLTGVALHAAHLVYMLLQAGAPIHADRDLRRTDGGGAVAAAREEPRSHAWGA
ncbi:MAG TPA: hypothetical protein VFZ36_05525 [Vicinamibacterales bacterium]